MLKALMRFVLGIYVSVYRLTGGKVGGQMAGLNVLLLLATGRKSGKQHTTPLGYFEAEGGYVIIGSNAGADTHPAWFYNLKSSPRATIEIKDKQYAVSAEIAGPDKRGPLWKRLIELAPAYRNYEKSTTREIPLVILRPIAT